MRTIYLIMAAFLVAACMSETKPYLKHVEVDIPARIANLQKWLDQDVAAKTIDYPDAKAVREKLDRIKENYNRLQSAGPLTPKDSEEINRMLDQTSDRIFRLDQKKRKGSIKG